jgi:hypothetical protein
MRPRVFCAFLAAGAWALEWLAPEAAYAEAARTDDARAASLGVGAYRMIDRTNAAYDGPEVDVRARVAFARRFSFVSELGTAGEFAGGRGTCLGEVAWRGGIALVGRPGPRWLELEAAAGAGVVYARLYGSLSGTASEALADPALVAWGDRWLPQAWATLGASIDVAGPLSLSVFAFARAVPAAHLDVEHVPDGMSADFYPAFRRDHEFSTFGASVAVALRF